MLLVATTLTLWFLANLKSVSLTIRYDNAIQSPQGTGIGTAVGRTVNTAVTGGGA